MATDIQIQITGGESASAMLKAVGGLMNGPRRSQLLFSYGGILQSEAARTFRNQADPVTGAPWKPTGSLAMSTRAGGGKTLVDTAGLLNDLVSGIPVIEGDKVSIKSNKVYGPIQNEGGTITPKNAKFLAIPLTRRARLAGSPRRFRETPTDRLRDNYAFVKSVTIPARPFIGVSQTGLDRIVNLTIYFINSNLGSIIAKRA